MNLKPAFEPVEYEDRWFLDLEENGGLVTHMGALQFFDEPPTDPDVLASVDFLSNLVPRFRRKVIGLRTGLPVWANATDFRPERHLEVRELGDCGLREVLATSARFYAADFDRSKPLWETLFLKCAGATPSSVFIRAHHMIGDGMSLFRLEADRPLRDTDLSSRDDGLWADGRLTVGVRTKELAQLAGQAIETSRHLASSAEFRRQARGQLKALRRYGAQALKAQSRRPCSPGRARHFTAAHAKTDVWREIAHELGAGVNEVFLAIGIRTVADYWSAVGFPLPSVNVGMPVDARSSPDDPEAGNKVLRAWFSIDPLTVESSRLPELRETSLRGRELANIPMTPLTGLVLRGLPRPIRQRFQLRGLAATDLLASNLRYPRERFEFARRTVTSIYGFAPAMGLPVSMALCSYGDETTLGLSVDLAQVTQPQLLDEVFTKQLVSLGAGRLTPL